MTDHHDDPNNQPVDERALDDELAETDGMLGEVLTDILVPPEGIERRTKRNVQDELLRRSTLATAIDLLSVGWETTQRLFSDDPEDLR